MVTATNIRSRRHLLHHSQLWQVFAWCDVITHAYIGECVTSDNDDNLIVVYLMCPRGNALSDSIYRVSAQRDVSVTFAGYCVSELNHLVIW